MPTLLIASAADRLLPSMTEAARLAALLPDARRVTLPDSGHTALLEEGVALAAIMARAGFLPYNPAAAVGAADGTSGSGGSTADNSIAVAAAVAEAAGDATLAQPVPDPQRAAADHAEASVAASDSVADR